jgi:hypothetical protein
VLFAIVFYAKPCSGAKPGNGVTQLIGIHSKCGVRRADDLAVAHQVLLTQVNAARP